ncbi:MAG: AMP-binding protein [Steroidobacteraceae bacterium]
MEKVWLKEYPPEVPAEIDPEQFPSLKALIEDCLKQYADRDAFELMGRKLSYADLDRHSIAFAAWLQSIGLRKGDRIALMMPNLLQYPIAMFGALRAGLVVVNTNPLYTPDELKHQLTDAGATAIVILENFCCTLQKVLSETPVRHIVVTSVGELLGFPKSAIVDFVIRRVRKQVPAWTLPGALRFSDVLSKSAGTPLRDVEVNSQDLAFLQYTGGTTGIAKGAMLTQRNMVANALQCKAWHQQVPLNNPTYVVALPLYHIFSLTANCLLCTLVGGFGVMIPNPRDFPAFVKELQKNPPNILYGVNTLFNALMNTPGFEKIDFTRLVATVGGGMAVQAAVAERWLKATGCALTQGWGLTETSPVAAVNKLQNEPFNGSIGLPISSTEISIRDDDGKDLGLDATGEICVRGPQVMRGYWNRDDETALVMLPDGFIRTGDIGRMDSRGYVFIEDRKKDMISVSGFKVYPNEIEGVAAQHPKVFEAAAIGEPDERSGEVVALYVVRKDPSLTEAELIEFMRQSLTSYKVPRHVHFRESLPKTNVGKILRRALRDEK